MDTSIDPAVCTLDIESYGVLPRYAQNMFHPQRSLFTDKVPRRDLVATVALTLPEEDPRCRSTPPSSSGSRSSLCQGPPSGSELSLSPVSLSSSYASPAQSCSWNGLSLRALKPQHSLVLQPHLTQQRDWLGDWLSYIDTMGGQNIMFDVLYLRAAFPELRPILTPERILLVDAICLNYLHWEARKERSLKDIGPILGLFSYKEEDTPRGGRRFKGPSDPALHEYNAQDSHNTMLLIAEFARQIERDYPGTDKLSPFSVRFFSDVLWQAIRMVEAGTPMSRSMLMTLHEQMQEQARTASNAMAAEFGVRLENRSGEDGWESGCDATMDAFITKCFDTIDKDEEILKKLGLKKTIFEHKLVEITDGGKVSRSNQNRTFITKVMPESSPLRRGLELWDTFAEAKKIVSSYTSPILFQRTKATKTSHPLDSLLIGGVTCPAYLASVLALARASVPSGPASSSSATSAHGSASSSGTESSPCSSLTTVGSKSECPVYNPAVGITYPLAYVVPSSMKDASGPEGGQKQVRFSFKNPAPPTFPDPIRACYMSRFDGGIIVSADAGQIELRVPTIISGEPSYLRVFNEGGDPHADHAMMVMGDDVVKHPLWKKGVPADPRQFAGKRPNFEALYWAGGPKMQAACLKDGGPLIDIGFWMHLVEMRPKTRPVLYAWQQQLLRDVEKNRVIVLEFTGHSRLFEGFSQNNTREDSDMKIGEVLNFAVQPRAAIAVHRVAQQVSLSLPSLGAAFPLCYMWMNKYDALYFDCHPSVVDLIPPIILGAAEHVERREYWCWLCEKYGHFVPLDFEVKRQARCAKCGSVSSAVWKKGEGWQRPKRWTSLTCCDVCGKENP